MNNNTINSKPYWEHRFNSGNWGRNGQLQTEEYAKANVENLNINKDFTGSILDFGCAQGDAIPIYLKAFLNAKIFGIDISESAIAKCNKKFGNIAEFYSGDTTKITYKDIVIASHVMEHIPKDKNIVKNLLTKCTDLFVFVPYKEEPLYFEHVNYYDENYYNELNVY